MQYLGQLKPWRRTRDVFLKHISFYQLRLWNSYRATRTTSPHDTYLFIYQKWYSFVSVTIWIHPTTPARSFFLLQHVELQIHAMITARHLCQSMTLLLYVSTMMYSYYPWLCLGRQWGFLLHGVLVAAPRFPYTHQPISLTHCAKTPTSTHPFPDDNIRSHNFRSTYTDFFSLQQKLHSLQCIEQHPLCVTLDPMDHAYINTIFSHTRKCWTINKFWHILFFFSCYSGYFGLVLVFPTSPFRAQ